nr:putative remorin [Tanacetum cinerariifolium]
MRVKFSGIEDENEGETSRVRERRLPSQKSLSFKGDNRRSQNWYRGQSSRELTYDYDSDYLESDEFRTAVAAAAYAIGSVKERRRARRRRDDSLSKPKRKQEDGAVSVTRRARERTLSSSASNKMKNKEDNIVPISTPSLFSRKISGMQEKVSRERSKSPAKTEIKGEKPRGSTGNSSPFFKRTSTSFDNQTGERNTGSSFASNAGEQGPFPSTEVNAKRSEHMLEDRDTKAEVWEKTEMERIKERYEKLYAKILEWENEKKAKAKKKLSRKQQEESEKKRARALQSYKNDMEMIDQIAEGARSQASENQKKEILKVKEKADTIRLTGKIPTKTCLCF